MIPGVLKIKRRFFRSARLCPLCGGRDYYRVGDMISYDALREKLNAWVDGDQKKKGAWLEYRQTLDEVPPLLGDLAARGATTWLPGFAADREDTEDEDDGDIHCRCKR